MDLVLPDQPAEDLLEGPIAVGHRRRPVARVRQRHQEGLDVLATDGRHVDRHTLLYQERIELIERLDVSGHRGWGQILCSKMAREGADRIGQIEVRASVGDSLRWHLTAGDSAGLVVGKLNESCAVTALWSSLFRIMCSN